MLPLTGYVEGFRRYFNLKYPRGTLLVENTGGNPEGLNKKYVISSIDTSRA
jgi:hypothetical protein